MDSLITKDLSPVVQNLTKLFDFGSNKISVFENSLHPVYMHKFVPRGKFTPRGEYTPRGKSVI